MRTERHTTIDPPIRLHRMRGPRPRPMLSTVTPMADQLDTDAMLQRFRDRAHAVKTRPLPPVAGEERTKFIQQAQNDYQDFAIIGDAEVTVEDGVLVFRIDLRPPGTAT